MQLFYVVNGWAGRVAHVDEAARLFYIGALPLLWCGLAWLLLAAPRSWAAFSRRRIVAAASIALLGAFLVWHGLEWATREIWGTPIFSPRPFVTHRVNLLVVEPNDNSYPCLEVLLAALGATLCWAASLRAGSVAWGWTILFGVSRVFCGTNYPIDVGAGGLLGWALSAFALALWHAPLRIPSGGGGRLKWRRGNQAVLSLGCIAVVVGAALAEMLHSPQALPRRQALLGSHATAAPANFDEHATAADNTPGASGALPLDGAYGRQPKAEGILRRALENLKLAHRVVDVEVAQVTVGNSIFRVASASFEVQPARADERREVARTAARIARAAFAADPQTQNVDVLGVIFQARPSGESFGEGGPVRANAEPRPLPVFTASIQKSNMVLRGKSAWANARGVDDGLWLRARSRLFIDPQVLAHAPQPTSTPAPTPIPTAKPIPTARPAATTKPAATAKPTAKPVAPPLIPKPQPKQQPKPQPKPRPKAQPKPAVARKPQARPRKYLRRAPSRPAVRRKSPRRRARPLRRGVYRRRRG